MKTKCHYNGPEFVPCEKMGSQKVEYTDRMCVKFSDARISVTIDFCPFCGESLKKPESDKPWWLVDGVTIKHIACGIQYSVQKLDDGNLYLIDNQNELPLYKENPPMFKPIGGPFDMIPRGFDTIDFRDNGSGFILKKYHSCIEFPIWHNCPEVFKGKTFSLEGLK